MSAIKLLYGHHTIPLELPTGFVVDCIEPAYVAPASDPLAVVTSALLHPLAAADLSAFSGAQSVAIAINDKTRPVPHEHILPPLLYQLESLGIAREAICFYIATGTHLPMPADEFHRVLPPEIIQKYKVISHNIDDTDHMVNLGTTVRGSNIWVNQSFYESDLKIVVGNIEPHHFAGFSGGYKTASIGLGGRETINHNHAMLIDPASRIAAFDDNPLRQDIEEIGEKIGVHFALNAILNSDLKIVHAVFGSPSAVMHAGIPLSRAVCGTSSGGDDYDIVIASAGGAPKDINFYQSQKALTHAALYVRPGGVILLAAECPEGSGNRAYEQFMEDVPSFEAVFQKFQVMGFRVGPHKAFQVARIAQHAQIVLLSSIEPARVERLLMTPAASLSDGLTAALRLLGRTEQDRLRVAVLPHATNTVKMRLDRAIQN